MVAETLAKRFWQQVMKKKKRERKKKCAKGNKMHWERCIAQLLCDRGSFHIQYHLGPLPELERRWGRCFGTALMVPREEHRYQHRHQAGRGIWLQDTCSFKDFQGSISVASFWGFVCCLHVLGCFLTMSLGIKQQRRDRLFARCVCSEPFRLQRTARKCTCCRLRNERIKKTPTTVFLGKKV